MTGRRGITFIEIMAALALFSAVVATALISMRAARESLEQVAMERRAREALQTWRISQATDDPLPEEFEDEEGWVWRIREEAVESRFSFTEEEVEAALAAPDMETALRMLGLDPDTLAAEARRGAEKSQADRRAPLLQPRWSSIRVELLRTAEQIDTEPVVVLRRRYVRSMETNQLVASALSAGSRQARAFAAPDAASIRAGQAGPRRLGEESPVEGGPAGPGLRATGPVRSTRAPAVERDAAPVPDPQRSRVVPRPVERRDRGREEVN